MRNEKICRNYCEKTGECLLDKIDQKTGMDYDEEQLIEDVKVAMPSRAKAFDSTYKDAMKVFSEELEQKGSTLSERRQQGEPISDEDYDFGLGEERFVWSDRVECSRAAEGVGPFAVYTLIDVTGPSTYVSDLSKI